MFFLHIALTCQLPVECRWCLKTLSLLGMFYRNTGHITTYMELHFHTTTVNFKVIYLRGWSNQLDQCPHCLAIRCQEFLPTRPSQGLYQINISEKISRFCQAYLPVTINWCVDQKGRGLTTSNLASLASRVDPSRFSLIYNIIFYVPYTI